MQQYYLNKELNDTVLIQDDKFHYLKNVIRIKKGENILLFNNFLKAKYKIEQINKKDIVASKIEEIPLEKESLNITLVVGLLKKDNTELVIQKAVELGAKEVVLTKFINNVVKLDNKEEKKLKRYNEISISACEQSKRDSLCEVKYINSIEQIDLKAYNNTYLLYEQTKSTDSLYKQINSCNKKDKILLIVGPEGGFDNKELEYFKNNKVEFTSLGKNILRAETAAIMAVGLTTNILNEKE